MSNLALWDTLEKTDPRHTKEFSGKGGFSGTAINATYILKKLTDAFGPCGRGWKFVVDSERIEDGHVLKSGDKARLHIIMGHLEYYQDGVWYKTSPQFGQTFLVSENKYGAYTDEEAPKKSITDCISKCAVLLGIGADVHLGMFDDSKYVNRRLEEEQEADGTAPKPAARTTGPLPPKPKPEASSSDKKDEAMTAAIKFAMEACEALEKLKTRDQLESWRTKQVIAKIDRLVEYDKDLSEMVIRALHEATARVM